MEATSQCTADFGSFSSDHRRGIEIAREKTDDFKKKYGRRPRILIACAGMDGSERQTKVLASVYADLGFDVDISPGNHPFEHVARMAVENDVHAIGIAVPNGEHSLQCLSDLPEIMEKAGGEEVLIILHGGFSAEIRSKLSQSGIDYIVDADTVAADFVVMLLDGFENQK